MIEGWAFSKNSEEKQERFSNRYKELKGKGIDIYIDIAQSGYAHKIYEGVIIDDMGENLTALDIGLLCDKGNLCFGGKGSIGDNGRFRFKVHTD